MRFRTKLFFGALISAISVATAVAGSNYSESMYRRAILDGDSTSPLYLLFTLHDAKTGKDRVVCTLGSGLVGAIHFERHLDFDSPSHKKAKAIALSQPHRFSFTNREALHTVELGYSEAMLNDFRSRLAKMSRSQLIAAVESHELDGLYKIGPTSRWNTRQEALAHALLERGVLVGKADITGGLFVERTFFW
ncbi:MAG TPA: hypothetical protein VEP30_12590 [Chthoniobacterales bacterium]|nr:hypothetical protein [Chthoniobacterales bacterium]